MEIAHEGVAKMPHMWCKISGLVTEANHENWTRKDLKPYSIALRRCARLLWDVFAQLLAPHLVDGAVASIDIVP